MHTFFLYLFCLLFIAAGIAHFVQPKLYTRIMPQWVPWHQTMVYISGALEIILGILLCFTHTRPLAAWAIMVLLAAIFPANIEMARKFKQKQHPYYWLSILRLPMQVLLIWWAWQYTR